MEDPNLVEHLLNDARKHLSEACLDSGIGTPERARFLWFAVEALARVVEAQSRRIEELEEEVRGGKKSEGG